jgi:hypothetical protein
MIVTLTPAYGRDYKSKAAVLEDWFGGKDFQIATMMHPDCGRYTSCRDWPEEQELNIRYARLRKVLVTRGAKE